MKLTKYMKETFVEAVMQDVPKVNNHDAMQEILNDAIRASNLPDVNILYDRYPDLFNKARVRVFPDESKLTHHGWELIRDQYFYVPPHYKLIAGVDNSASDLVTLGIITGDQYNELVSLLTDERNDQYKRSCLEIKLVEVVAGCGTTEQLRGTLPEFEKYMPSEEGTLSKNLPAIASVVADFVAAGWPKDKE